MELKTIYQTVSFLLIIPNQLESNFVSIIDFYFILSYFYFEENYTFKPNDFKFNIKALPT